MQAQISPSSVNDPNTLEILNYAPIVASYEARTVSIAQYLVFSTARSIHRYGASHTVHPPRTIGLIGRSCYDIAKMTDI